MTLSEIQAKIRNAPVLDFGDIFNQSVELFKKSWLYGLMFQLIVLVITLPFIIVLYVPFVMSMIAQSKSGHFNPDIFGSLFAGFTIFYIIVFIFGIFAAAVFQLALQAALFRIIKDIDEGKEVKASTNPGSGPDQSDASTVNMSVGNISRRPQPAAKTTGIKMRGTGAATKGLMSRGPMA